MLSSLRVTDTRSILIYRDAFPTSILLRSVQTRSGAHQRVMREISPRAKRPELEAHHPFPSGKDN
jgi:hypothetical protein